jgi:CubicO group peptidase (beta-lactamase class C family)
MTVLARSTAEQQSVASQAISDFISAIEQQDLELHSMVLVRHGHIIADAWWSPYQEDDVHLLYSLSKSFTSSAIGLAVAEDLLSVTDKVVSFFPEKLPETVAEYTQAMQVQHLLSMASGHTEDTMAHLAESADWVRTFLSLAPDQAPGSVFCYNNGATFMLSAILHTLTGQSLLDYLQPRLLGPLGIEQARWQRNPEGIQLGFSGLHLRTVDIAKFGQLYLQRGQWQGQQLLSAEWVDLATQRHVDSTNPDPAIRKPDWEQGYGYQFWRCRHNAYRGDGAFGQFCLVLPEQDAVLAITAGEEDMQAVLDVFWAQLLPAMQAGSLEPQPEAQEILTQQLSQLSYQPVAGARVTEQAAELDGQRYEFSEILAAGSGFPRIRSLQLEAHSDGWLLRVDAEKSHELPLGYASWAQSQTDFATPETYKLAASAAWTSNTTFLIVLRFLESPHSLTLKLTVKAGAVLLDMAWNVSFGPLEAATSSAVKAR